MEIGINIYSGIDFKKQVELFKKHGVTRTFIGSKIPDFDEVMQLFRENGIVCETIHAPYDRINDMWNDDDDGAGDDMLQSLKLCVDRCVKYGIDTVVVHVSSGRPMPEITERGAQRYDKFVSYAKSRNVAVAFENLRYFENLKFLMDRYDDAVFCWDNGHASCYTYDVDYMKIYSGRVGAIHIHDNRCIKDSDEHLLPFDGKINMESVAASLAKSGYNGTLMLEITKNARVDSESVYAGMSDEEYFERAVKSAKKLADMVERNKTV